HRHDSNPSEHRRELIQSIPDRQRLSVSWFGGSRAPTIYFEDLEIGAETQFGSYDVTREEVLEFAHKYDPQPFHISDEEAAKTHFGRIAASGWHTAAMTMAVIARHVVKHEQAGLGSPGIDELRWKKPVY